MKISVVLRGLTLGMVTSFMATASLADSAGWDSAKADQIATNRHSDAGRGNGGERLMDGVWQETLYGEDGPMDRDPGNSAGNNKACGGDKPSITSC